MSLRERLVMVVRGKTEASDMKNFLSGFRGREKSAVAPAASMFARRYQERVLRKTEETRVVADEVFHMPVKAGLAARPSAYEFQGSFVYPSVEKPEKRPADPSAKRRGAPGTPGADQPFDVRASRTERRTSSGR